MLEHVLRIDRIFRQPQGHLLLIGVSGAGKLGERRFLADLELFLLTFQPNLGFLSIANILDLVHPTMFVSE